MAGWRTCRPSTRQHLAIGPVTTACELHRARRSQRVHADSEPSAHAESAAAQVARHANTNSSIGLIDIRRWIGRSVDATRWLIPAADRGQMARLASPRRSWCASGQGGYTSPVPTSPAYPARTSHTCRDAAVVPREPGARDEHQEPARHVHVGASTARRGRSGSRPHLALDARLSHTHMPPRCARQAARIDAGVGFGCRSMCAPQRRDRQPPAHAQQPGIYNRTLPHPPPALICADHRAPSVPRRPRAINSIHQGTHACCAVRCVGGALACAAAQAERA